MGTAFDQDTEQWRARFRNGCPSRTVLEVLANKWALYVLSALRRADGPMRFNELRRLLGDITQKMLTQTLKNLERDGLVARTVYPTVPPRVEYALTELGVDVGRLTHAVGEWAVTHAPEIIAARARYDGRASQPPVPVTMI
ncbi:winged helix-turn-helix transcriptional regulator [Pseudofrankia inefficax]|uniref:Transcriptional regulator, HxlR family n=1 Tax=Pseudofrankia inefficax (strain DSM 45817 / CECT 9037 / DDB 130130 / EuI1c) TaxID=298654 RepID=E3JCS9_PSEI1|nr:helix-turn-helix domain-containing protein [Pseudofrankia inefficax]ADP79919.1 transcriptional regulator, HxlR family [Pseudofrankia inefficax]